MFLVCQKKKIPFGYYDSIRDYCYNILGNNKLSAIWSTILSQKLHNSVQIGNHRYRIGINYYPYRICNAFSILSVVHVDKSTPEQLQYIDKSW